VAVTIPATSQSLPDGKHVLIAVGSAATHPILASRQCERRYPFAIWMAKNARQFATGLRNPVGLAIEPVDRHSVDHRNERDELGDDLPPDYLTSLQDGGFTVALQLHRKNNVDPRVKPQKPDLVAKAIVPDVLPRSPCRSPCSSLFTMANNFQKAISAALLSRNTVVEPRQPRRLPGSVRRVQRWQASSAPVPFFDRDGARSKRSTGLWPPSLGHHRPDGALLVSDDGGRSI